MDTNQERTHAEECGTDDAMGAGAHTPGPWTVHRSSDRSEHVVEARPDAWSGKQYLGQVIAHYTTDPASAANLRLIAAAPDLLTALLGVRALLSQLVFLAPSSDNSGRAIMASGAALARTWIDSAVAKARG